MRAQVVKAFEDHSGPGFVQIAQPQVGCVLRRLRGCFHPDGRWGFLGGQASHLRPGVDGRNAASLVGEAREVEQSARTKRANLLAIPYSACDQLIDFRRIGSECQRAAE
jgi:hypothetical protein